jgi:hypothetical protein
MAHDPISALAGRTYEERLTIELPRIEGVIEGEYTLMQRDPAGQD